MNTPPVVSPDEWQTAWENLLVKEKELTRSTWPSVNATTGQSFGAVTAAASTGARPTDGSARSASVPGSAPCTRTCCEPRSSWPPSTPGSRYETSRSPPVTTTPELPPSKTGDARTSTATRRTSSLPSWPAVDLAPASSGT